MSNNHNDMQKDQGSTSIASTTAATSTAAAHDESASPSPSPASVPTDAQASLISNIFADLRKARQQPQPANLHSIKNRRVALKECEPVSWESAFHRFDDVRDLKSGHIFRVYRSDCKNPISDTIIVLVHGAGLTALSYAALSVGLFVCLCLHVLLYIILYL
jgi:hypothetical protein